MSVGIHMLHLQWPDCCCSAVVHLECVSSRSSSSDVIFRSGVKVRPIISFYVRIITSHRLTLRTDAHGRYTFEGQLLSLFKRLLTLLPPITSTHLLTISICHCAVNKSVLGVWKYSAAFCSCLFHSQWQRFPSSPWACGSCLCRGDWHWCGQ